MNPEQEVTKSLSDQEESSEASNTAETVQTKEKDQA